MDVAQIRTYEDMYRVLDNHVSLLLPFIGLQFNNYNVQGMIYNIRHLQSSLEDKLHTFYQNLSEWEQLKAIFSLPQFQNHLFLNAVNRSINNSLNQGIKNHSLLEKCTSKTATEPKVVVDSFCTSFTKNEKAALKN